MSKQELIDSLVENNVQLIYGKDNLPVSVQYDDKFKSFIDSNQSEIMQINRWDWENVQIVINGVVLKNIKGIQFTGNNPFNSKD